MGREHIIFTTIFYILLTLFFIYLFINEKKIVKKVDEKREKIEDSIIERLNWKETNKAKIFKKISKFIESFGSAIILVLIIQKFYIGNFLVPTGSMIPTIIPKDRLFGNMVIYNFKKPKREDIIVFREPIENKVLYTKRLMGLPGERVQIKYDSLFINNKKISDREYTPLGLLGDNEWIIPKKGDILTIKAENFKGIEITPINIEEIQKHLGEISMRIDSNLPEVRYFINGVETGPVLDYMHDKSVVEKLLKGEEVKITLDEDYYLALGDNTNGSYDSRMWGFVKDSRIKGEALIRFWPLNRIGILK